MGRGWGMRAWRAKGEGRGRDTALVHCYLIEMEKCGERG